MEKGAGISPPSSSGQAATAGESSPRTRRTERTSLILLQNTSRWGEKKGKKEKKIQANKRKKKKRLPLEMITGAVSPSEHEHKSAAFSRERAACGEDGLTESLCCRRRGA